jgi:hypothetical protein
MKPPYCSLTIFTVFLFLTGCQLTGTGTWMGKTGEGTVGSAGWTANKCQAILDWIEPFKKEYPNLDLTNPRRGYYNLPELGNLFRDSSFVPVYGFPYNGYNSGKTATINRTIVHACMGWGPNRYEKQKDLFLPLKVFFDTTFSLHNANVARYAKDYTEREEWMKKAIAELEIIPEDRDGYNKIRIDILARAEGMVAPLWPSEKEFFLQKVRNRMDAIAAKIGPAESEGPAVASVPRLDTSVPGVLEERIQPWLIDLAGIPLTLEGRDRSREWRIGFDREFAGDGRDPDVRRADAAWTRLREQIFVHTKDDFIARLDELPKGPGGAAAHKKLLAETFTLPQDRDLPSYNAYREEAELRERSVLRRMLAGAANAVKKGGGAISDAARGAVHGSEDKGR